MYDLLDILVTSTASGCIYGLMALSFLLAIRPTGIINFAVGEWAAAGAFVAIVVTTWLNLPFLASFFAVLIVMFALGWATEFATVRPLVERGAPLLAPILVLLAVLVIIREVIGLIFGPDQFALGYPFGFRRIQLGPVGGSERTVWGRAFEAVAINRRAASLMGINLSRVAALSFAGSAACAGLAGLLVGPITSVHWQMGLTLAIQGFSALVVGGVGRVEGALLGGIVLALAEQLTQRYAPIPSGLALGVPFLLLIVFLIVRPSGLLKAREAR
jgi:branched-chain amino acid transport system permease protein